MFTKCAIPQDNKMVNEIEHNRVIKASEKLL